MPGTKHGTIKVILKRKIEDWLSSIEDEEVRELAKTNVLVTGGAIASLLEGNKPSDYDLYFKSYNATLAIANYYADRFNQSHKPTNYAIPYQVNVKTAQETNIKGDIENRIIFYMKSAGIATETQTDYKYYETVDEVETTDFVETSLSEDQVNRLTEEPAEVVEGLETILKEGIIKVNSDKTKEKVKYRPIILTDNAVTLSNKVQIIIRFYGNAEEIHKNFDFVHATCLYDYQQNTLEIPYDALSAVLSKTLIYRGSLYPVASIFRIRKFLNRGWRISAGQMLKIIFQISELDLKNIKILRDQLIGVDVAYMHQLIRALEDVKPLEKIDGAYIASIVDKIFDE